jgi:TRAP-type C4-dicarboxylate transport system permease small subunit
VPDGSSGVAVNRYVGLLTIVGGLCLVFAGLLIYTGWLSWFGRLPGDIRYEGDHVQVYVPIVSMLIVSAVLSALFYLLRRFF